MDLLLEQLIRNVAASGLMSADAVRVFVDGLPAEKRPEDGLALASELTADGKLTPYQAESLCRGETAGLKFDQYIVQEKIGEGGMGVVLKGEHLRMHRPVAIKRLHANTMDSPAAVERFYREVEVAAKLYHDNIVTALDAREHEGVHYLIMEYVEGQDLATVVRQRGPLPVEEAVDYIIQAAQGLAYAHSKGIVHRDIKPGNLLVTTASGGHPLANGGREPTGISTNEPAHAGRSPSTIVKILDMGLARIKETNEEDGSTGPERLTTDGQVMGTGDYMAPEQAENAHEADHRADVYSLGCTLYRLLTGRPPYSGISLMKLLIEHREAKIPSLRGQRPDVPEALDDVYQRMVAKNPDDRHQSMNEVIVALQKATGRGPTTAADAPPEQDSKLTSFLDQVRHEPTVVSGTGHRGGRSTTAKPTTTAQPTEEPSVEETIDQMPQEDTDPSAIEKRVAHPVAAPRQPRRRKSAREKKQTWMLLWMGAGLGLSLIGAAVVSVIIYLQTNIGTVVIEAGDHNVEVLLTQGGESIETINTKRKRRAELKTGEYQVSLKDDDGRLTLDKDTIVVTRGGEARVKVTRKQPTEAPPPRLPVQYVLQFDGKSSQVDLPLLKYDSSHPITIEAWLDYKPKEGNPRIIGNDSGSAGLTIQMRGKSLGFLLETAQGYVFDLTDVPTGPHHVALVCDEAQTRLYIDGKTRVVKPTGFAAIEPSDRAFRIGLHPHSVREIHGFEGRIDEVRFSNVARYRQDFAPRKRFQTDGDTMALYHFDEGGGGVAQDASIHRRDGQVVNAKWVPVDLAVPGAETEPSIAAAGNPDRAVATWVIDRGGRVQLSGQLADSEIREKKDLPDTPFRLIRVVLAETDVSDEQLAHLPGSAILCELHLNRTNITSIGLANLPDFPNLQLLHLGDTQITDDGLAHLKKYGKLDFLNLRGTRITDAGANLLAEFPSLRVLDLTKTEITDASLEEVARLPDLGFLNVSGTQVTDNGLRYLSATQTLDKIDVSGTEVTAEGVRALREALPDCNVIWQAGTSEESGEDLALEFDGQTAYLEIPTLTFDAKQPLTIEALVQPRSVGRTHVFRGEPFIDIASTGHWRCGIKRPGSTYIVSMSDLPAIAGKMVHLASVRDGRQLHLYVDGQPQLVTTRVDPPKPGGPPLNVGGVGFAGVIDEVRISRYARYQAPFIPAARFEPDDDTLALLHFDGAGNIARDASDSGNDGRIHGATRVRTPAYSPPKKMPVARTIDAFTSPDLKAAAWAGGLGGTLGISLNGDLELVGLVGAKLNDEDLSLLRGRKQLYFLDLQTSTVTDAGLKHLTGMDDLRFLFLDKTKVTDDGLPHLAALPKLQNLFLNGNDVTDIGIEHLAKMQQLQALMISYTKVTDESVPYLKRMSGLTTLDITGTKITQPGVQALREALPDCEIKGP